MPISFRPSPRPASVARATALCGLLATAAAFAPVQAQGEHMVSAGSDSTRDYQLDLSSIHREGNLVRYRITSNSRLWTEKYDGQLMVDCAARTRRELGAEVRSERNVLHNGGDAQMYSVFPNTRQAVELDLVCSHAGPAPVVVAQADPPPPPSPAPAPPPTPAPAAPRDVAPAAAVDFAPLAPVQMFAPHPVTLPRPASPVPPVPTPTLEVVRAPGRVHPIAAADDLAAAGRDERASYAILVDSVQRQAGRAGYDLQVVAPGASSSTHEHYIVDCDRKLRAFEAEDTPRGARLSATQVRPGTREARELATACALPEGPRRRWFAGFVVTPDGVVVAPHERTAGCATIATGVGAQRRTLELIGHEDEVTLLRLSGGGPWSVMPSFGLAPTLGGLPVTLLGVHGTAPSVSAAFAERAGANGNDPGWPQVRTLGTRALPEGIVWNGTGSAIGLALALHGADAVGGEALVRMLPASQVRLRLERHGMTWRTADRDALDAEAAMRLALAATIPLICTRAE